MVATQLIVHVVNALNPDNPQGALDAIQPLGGNSSRASRSTEHLSPAILMNRMYQNLDAV
jgi:hypothetical protein